mmetsp:Transcript_16432/g.67735  ORF Transcript_16432/g.67735 Transcript_16432/m.67735 type:complete len:94 (-) Transcript_16432:138-419(-)
MNKMNTMSGDVVIIPADLGKTSRRAMCPSCRQNVQTDINVEACTTKNWLWFTLSVLLAFPCAACCIFSKSTCNCTSEVEHDCPNCGSTIGVSK